MSNVATQMMIWISIMLYSGSIFAQGTMLLRQPTLSADHIVFVYADDLWIVPRSGGDAIRLTSHEGTESFPHFSNDGSMIAFSGEYGGNTDVYVVAANGGIPQRLTWHSGADVVQGWTTDGSIMFRSPRMAHPTETNSFYKVGLHGGLPQAMRVPRAAFGEMSPDGSTVAYTPITSWDPEWRNYRGGQAMPIWIQNLETGILDRIPQPDRERHLDPVWIGEEIYYLSERDYASNIWSYHTVTKTEKQITTHKVFDVKSLDAFEDDIIYEQGGYLHLIEGPGSTSRQLDINVKGDMNFSIPRWEDVRSSRIASANLSPNGLRAVMEYRGEIMTFPTGEGSPRSITSSSGIADRTPIWSPLGDKLAWFSDESGEYELVIADQYGDIQKRLTVPSQTFYFRPDWSADGSKIAFSDTHYTIWYVDLASDQFVKVDTDGYAHPNRTMNPVWSPDSRYLAYARQQDSHFKSIFIYDTMTKESHRITDYGLSSGWLDMSSFDPSITRSLYVTVLHADGSSPFLPVSDEEESPEDNHTSDDADERKEEEPKEAKKIDFNGVVDRTTAAPDAAGEYIGLARASEGKVLVMAAGDRGADLKVYDISEQEMSDFALGVRNITTTFDGSYVLYQKGGWMMSSTAGKPNPTEDAFDTKHKILVDPQAEYHQIFKEGWRYMRDFLYVDNVHGAPWDKVWQWYAPWIDHVRHRTDLNYVVDIMSGEVAIGHSYVRGGDMPDIDRINMGYLGADFDVEGGRYRIRTIYNGEHWNPDIYAPLADIGHDISEGDFITKINGHPVTSTDNIYRLLEGLGDQHIRLTTIVADGGAELTHVVKTISNESNLRMYEWMERNRRKVDELSNGELAYVWVPNTGGAGFSFFNRYYFSQQDKKGVIIDERNNGGGSAADYMIDVMAREHYGYFNSKAGDRRPWTTPISGIWGPKVMIINERAGSGGDLLPYMFKARGVGTLVGTRTWGGLVGTWDTPLFIDGGRMVAPRGGFYDVNGEWAVEGEGISPDIEVIMDPEQVLQGRDPQLETAVQEALNQLSKERFEIRPEPAAPIRSKRPEGWDRR